jgi:hypothetical protein
MYMYEFACININVYIDMYENTCKYINIYHLYLCVHIVEKRAI